MILLAVKNLVRQFSDAPILNGIDFEVRPGERIGLVGPNGAGKTTLLRLLAGLDEPDSGNVEVHPQARVNVRGCLRRARRRFHVKTRRPASALARETALREDRA